MALAAASAVFGIASGLINLVKFAQANFGPNEKTDAVIRFAIGVDGKQTVVEDGQERKPLSNAGGDLPDIRLWNPVGKFIGMKSDPGYVKEGRVGEVWVNTDGQQAPYALFTANNDAICIAYVTMTWPNSANQYAWLGDWAQMCDDGTPWYYSNVYVDGSSQTTKCMWIDGDGGKPTTGFQLHFPDFAAQPADAEMSKEELEQARVSRCTDGVAFKKHQSKDPSKITYWVRNNKRQLTAESEGPVKNRTEEVWTPRGASHLVRDTNMPTSHTLQSRHINRLIVDSSLQRTATELCQSESSAGPDFLNTAEGLFCRLSDKSLWPVCSEEVLDNCFKVDVEQLIIGGKMTRDNPYSRVTQWGEANQV